MMSRFKRPGKLQLAAVICGTVAVIFVVSFAEKAVQARELLVWRSELEDEIAQLEREKVNLQAELAQRQQPEWYDQVLRDAGYVGEGDVRVVVEVVQPEESVVATDDGIGTALTTSEETTTNGSWFNNDNWRAWQTLLWGNAGGH